jgi:adenylate cyclase
MNFLKKILNRRKRTQLHDAFHDYVSKEVIDDIIDGKFDDISKGTKKFLTISFTNMTGYVGLAEKLDLHDLKIYMDKYYSTIFNVIKNNDGVIDKFVADEIFCEYGIFSNINDHFQNACNSAIEQINEVENEFNPWAKDNNFPLLNIRIGISTGDLVVGNFGTDYAFDFTVMGEPVNFASSLTDKSRNFTPSILIDEETAKNIEGFKLKEVIDENSKHKYFHLQSKNS